MSVLEEKIIKLMKLPLEYQSGDCHFTASEVHFGLLKVMPSPLLMNDVEKSLETLYVQGRVVRAQRAKNGIYETVYSLARQGKDEATATSALPEATQQEEPLLTGENDTSLGELMRELDHVEGVLYNFMVASYMQHGSEQPEAVNAANLLMTSGWSWDADDPEPPNQAFAQKIAARKALANGSPREKLLVGLQALIEGRINELRNEECRADDDIAIISWRSGRAARIGELQRLLEILQEMESSE
jgi:hypothetical protein